MMEEAKRGLWERVLGLVRQGGEEAGGVVGAVVRPPRYRWWHALAFGVAVNLGNWPRNEDIRY